MLSQHDEIVTKVKNALLAMQRQSWEQGIAAQALLELGDDTGVALLARDAVNRQQPDGRVALIGGEQSLTGPAAMGEAILHAAWVTKDPVFNTAADRLLNWVLDAAPRNADGILYHQADKHQIWVDSFYMGPPFLAVAGCYAEAINQIEGYRRLLWHKLDRLYAQVWDEDKKGLVRPEYWGRGNGWAAVGLTRVIALLPRDFSQQKGRLSGYLKDHLDGCLVYLRPDGLFHNILDKPETFVETNLGQMLAYAIYRGVHGGWLAEDYLAKADLMRAAAEAKVDKYGLVQGACGVPAFDAPGTSPAAQAFFLLMQAAAGECRE